MRSISPWLLPRCPSLAWDPTPRPKGLIHFRPLFRMAGWPAPITSPTANSTNRTIQSKPQGTPRTGRKVKVMRTSSKAFVTVVLGLCLAAFASAVLAADQPAAADASYLQSFDKWKAELVDDLKQNWLPLAGLFWLKPGENKFGSDAKNDIVFPKGPGPARSVPLQSTDVSVRFDPG